MQTHSLIDDKNVYNIRRSTQGTDGAVAVQLIESEEHHGSQDVLAWTFLTDPHRFTLTMGLNSMVGQYSSNTPWSEFAAMAILITIPIVVLFFLLQRWIVSGLAVGAVKG